MDTKGPVCDKQVPFFLSCTVVLLTLPGIFSQQIQNKTR